MLYCRTCGQCNHITDDHFRASVSVYGYQTVDIDPVTEEITDYGDVGDWDSSGDGADNFACPNCDSSDIEFDSHISAEQAFQRRHAYEDELRRRRENYEQSARISKLKSKACDPNREWDIKQNV